MAHWIQQDLTFNEETHSYFWMGKPVDGVTGIMDRVGTRQNDRSPWNPVGCPDFAKREHDSNFGSAFHKVAEAVLHGYNVDFPESMTPWVEQFGNFLREFKPVPLTDPNGNKLIEYPMYSVRYKYAGTLDLAAYNKDGDIYLIDWKTATSYQKSYRLQTAAYEQLLKEVMGIKEKIHRLTVLINQDNYHLFERSGQPLDWVLFQSVLNTYRMAA
jgi:hypothetical protein